MGIFDVFKTKVGEAAEKAGDVAGKTWDKAGDVAGQAKDKVSDMMDKKKDDAADSPSAQGPAGAGSDAGSGPRSDAGSDAGSDSRPDSAAATAERASNMVSEGSPVAPMGEAVPGAGDDGMTRTIKDNVARGADKAGEMAGDATGHRHDDKIGSGVRQAKDKLG